MQLPKLNGYRYFFLAVIFVGPGLAAWVPYLAGNQSRLWLAIGLHTTVFILGSITYLCNWYDDDARLDEIRRIRRLR